MKNTQQYAHVLLFACPQCERPLAVTYASSARSLEAAEAEGFLTYCVCGWTGTLAGVTAVKHWVEAWPGGVLGVLGNAEGARTGSAT